MIDLYEEFARVIQALEAGGLEYALWGGMAPAVHGGPRVSMPPSAVTARLRRVAQLRRLCLCLARAGSGRVPRQARPPEQPLPPPQPPQETPR